MAKQQLDRTQVLGAAVDQRVLGAPHRVGSVVRRIEAQFLDPPVQDPRVLPGTKVRRPMGAARKQEVLRSQPGLLDPLLHGISSRLGDLELHGPLRLVLHDDGARCHLVAVTDVPHFQADEVTASQLAIDAEVEQRQLTHPLLHLQANS